MNFRLIGPGRAGLSMSNALQSVGWSCEGVLGRGDDPVDAARGVDALIVAVPDDEISPVARSVELGAPLVHLSGAATLESLAPHNRRASLHPLASLADPVTGARRLTSGITFAVAGDPIARSMAQELGGNCIDVPDQNRACYHAAAAVAANHLVALCAQVERLADKAEVPVDIYWNLMDGALMNVRSKGAAAALTGPAARGDSATIAAHLNAIGQEEQDLYQCLAEAAAQLARDEAHLRP